MKNLTNQFKNMEGLTNKRIVQTSKTVYNKDIMKKEPLERAMNYAKMVREFGTSVERLYIKNNEIYYGDKFECEDMIICLVDYECDRFYRVVYGSDDNKHITCYRMCDGGMGDIDITNIEDINNLDESDIVKEVLRRMFITLGK